MLGYLIVTGADLPYVLLPIMIVVGIVWLGVGCMWESWKERRKK